MIRRCGQADIPREVSGRRDDHQCTVTTKQMSARLITDALTMQLNVVKAITESSAVSLGFFFTKTK